jgi:hypothetical protein
MTEGAHLKGSVRVGEKASLLERTVDEIYIPSGTFIRKRDGVRRELRKVRTTNRAQALTVRRGQIRLYIEYVCMRGVRLHNREPTEGNAQRFVRE